LKSRIESQEKEYLKTFKLNKEIHSQMQSFHD